MLTIENLLLAPGDDVKNFAPPSEEQLKLMWRVQNMPGEIISQFNESSIQFDQSDLWEYGGWLTIKVVRCVQKHDGFEIKIVFHAVVDNSGWARRKEDSYLPPNERKYLEFSLYRVTLPYGMLTQENINELQDLEQFLLTAEAQKGAHAVILPTDPTADSFAIDFNWVRFQKNVKGKYMGFTDHRAEQELVAQWLFGNNVQIENFSFVRRIPNAAGNQVIRRMRPASNLAPVENLLKEVYGPAATVQAQPVQLPVTPEVPALVPTAEENPF
jgi:hypothetical protein